MAKKKKKCKCKENRYLGFASITVNTFNEENRKPMLKAMAKAIMILDKCRIGTYATLNTGAPHCGPHGCG
jgi:hypothetical protein